MNLGHHHPSRCGLVALTEVAAACAVLGILLGLGMNLGRIQSRLRTLRSVAAERQQALNILAHTRAQGLPPTQSTLPTQTITLDSGLCILHISLSDGSHLATLFAPPHQP